MKDREEHFVDRHIYEVLRQFIVNYLKLKSKPKKVMLNLIIFTFMPSRRPGTYPSTLMGEKTQALKFMNIFCQLSTNFHFH